MSITLLKPFNIDTTANYTFNQVTVTSNVDLSGTAKVTLGNVSNIIITGGSNTQVLSTDGTGNLSWVTQSGGGGGSSISNGTSNVNIATANGNITIGVNGTANAVVVSGTGVIFNGNANVVGNLTTGNLITSGSGGNISGANNVTANTFTGTITTNAQPNITSVGTLSNLTVTGNTTVGALITGSGSGGNVSGANFVIANFFTGTLTTAAQPNITSVGTLTSLSVTGNVNASLFVSNVATGTAPLTVTSTTRVANLNVAQANVADFISITTATSGNSFLLLGNAVTGNIAESANSVFVANSSNGAIHATTFVGSLSGAATTAATVTTNAQPNITSVGTLTSLAVTGNAQFSGANVSLGNVSNLKITGGSNTQVLSTDGTGNLSWVTQSGGGASGIAVQDEGSNVVTVANIINFVGSGVTASNVGGVATITVSGGGGGAANIVIRNEGNILTNSVSSIDFVGSGVDATVVGNAVTVTVSSGGGSGSQAAIFSDTFTGNGVQTAFVLSTIPDSIDSTFVNIDGVSQLRTAYTLSGSTLTFTSAPIAAAEIEVTTIQSVVSGYSNLTTRNYTGNGVQTTFAVTSGVTATSLLVTENGVLQTPGTDYTVSSANLIFDGAPANGVNIQVRELQTVIPEPVGEGLVYSRSSMIATAGQTNFAVVYSVGYLQVYLNGVLLNATDYVATTGITIVLDEAAAAGDLLEIITYNLIPFNQIQAATFNSTNLTNNMVITSGYSAVSVGPLSVADGVTISIAAGQKWVIL